MPAFAQPPGYTHDESDWWSMLNKKYPETKIKEEKREPAGSNFQILGISLDEKMFAEASRIIGPAMHLERGDAGTGREQACYVSAGNSPPVHLIFETGELNEVFYLFEGGPPWQGNAACLNSKLVTRKVRTASGLHLGQTPAQVEAILGKPTATRSQKMIYSFIVQKKMTPTEFQKSREQRPDMSDEQAHQNFDYYFLSVYIEARFVDGKLNYLAVSKAETT
jgi:hypothetical protein